MLALLQAQRICIGFCIMVVAKRVLTGSFMNGRFSTSWRACAMSRVNVAAAKNSTQSLPCFSGLPWDTTICLMAYACPYRAAYTMGEILPGR